ncbi:hypothetical protein BSK59_13435 [Paenibacillus odorifer]|uniref:hypothetical protein n=1 Tax=Paenibacillus odorifer TaxID=189426 RepID=UPI00096D9A13|nr:hypothetical protein [Paenibacillus odorifer]OME55475.1 hypothetical protein BSK59_13435 [Paenibacillus odorifer]
MKKELQPTYGNFVLKGVVGGTQSDKFYNFGSTNGSEWRRLNFSVKVNDNASVFVEMMGNKNEKVKLVDNSDKKNKQEMFVPWADRYKERKDKFEIFMASKVGLVKEENSEKNKVYSLTQYDATEYIKNNLKDGDSVYIRGSMEYSKYDGKAQVKYKIQQIYSTSEPIEFNDEYEPEASFNQEIVYLDSEYDETTNKTAINTYVIFKDKSGVHPLPYMFFINHEKYKNDEEKTKALNNLKSSFERLTYGSSIKVNGNINIYMEKVEEGEEQEIEDVIPDFGGFQAKGQETYVRGNTIRELEITGGDGKTLILDRYDEEDFIPTADPFSDNDGNIQKNPFEDDDNLPF